MREPRELSELINVEDPAWPPLLEELSDSDVPVEILPADTDTGRASLRQLQISARSNLGGIVLNCGGLLVEDGWLRIFGSPSPNGTAHEGLPGLAEINGMPTKFDPAWQPDAGLVVAHDVLGGVFALNGHNPRAAGRPGEPGEILYFAPDALAWEALGAGHSAWLSWILSGGLDKFYESLRWRGWREEVPALDTRHGLSVFPPLWSAEARQDLAATSRRPISMAEILALSRDTCLQLNGTDPGFLGAV